VKEEREKRRERREQRERREKIEEREKIWLAAEGGGWATVTPVSQQCNNSKT
jgi:hypothetical protein